MTPKVLTFVMLLLIAAHAGEPPKKKKQPSGFEKVLRSMFPSAKPKITIKKVKPAPVPKHKHSNPQSESISGRIYVPVDLEWIARYWEQEAAWDYYIPDDDQIKFLDGRYLVPIVVFRHYEDMLNSRRRASPTPTPAPD